MGATIGPRSKVCLDFQYKSLPLLTNKRVEDVPQGDALEDYENVPTVTMNFYDDIPENEFDDDEILPTPIQGRSLRVQDSSHVRHNHTLQVSLDQGSGYKFANQNPGSWISPQYEPPPESHHQDYGDEEDPLEITHTLFHEEREENVFFGNHFDDQQREFLGTVDAVSERSHFVETPKSIKSNPALLKGTADTSPYFRQSTQ